MNQFIQSFSSKIIYLITAVHATYSGFFSGTVSILLFYGLEAYALLVIGILFVMETILFINNRYKK